MAVRAGAMSSSLGYPIDFRESHLLRGLKLLTRINFVNIVRRGPGSGDDA